jgi:putative tricarboxylic transport membrane protein
MSLMQEMLSNTARSAVHPGELLLSLGLVVLGAFIAYETGGIAENQGYAQIGPRLFPYLIGAGLTLCGAVLAWHALSGGWRNIPLDQEGHGAPDWPAFAIISAGIVLHMVIIGWAGFIIASTLLFVLIARGFGSRRPARDALVAVLLAVAVFFIFTVGLGLSLPRGPFVGA